MTEKANDDEDKRGPHPRSSFSLAQALVSFRLKQEEQQRAKDEEEKKVEEEKKERARAKRRRRRQNQKLAKAAARERLTEETEHGEEEASEPETSPTQHDNVVTSLKDQSDLKRKLDESDSTDLQPTKRKKSRRKSVELEASDTVDLVDANRTGGASGTKSKTARQFVPRALMVKRKQG